jgi:hypothetical protein
MIGRHFKHYRYLMLCWVYDSSRKDTQAIYFWFPTINEMIDAGPTDTRVFRTLNPNGFTNIASR